MDLAPCACHFLFKLTVIFDATCINNTAFGLAWIYIEYLLICITHFFSRVEELLRKLQGNLNCLKDCVLTTVQAFLGPWHFITSVAAVIVKLLDRLCKPLGACYEL